MTFISDSSNCCLLHKPHNNESTPFIYLCIPEIHLILLEHLPADHASMVDDDIKVGPSTKLALPVGDSGERSNYEKWPFNAHMMNLFEECDGLDGLPKAHLICQDAVSSNRVR